jgi:hypothetical protein
MDLERNLARGGRNLCKTNLFVPHWVRYGGIVKTEMWDTEWADETA